MLKNNDPLCPLGFHPQVRWPTRCKRCYREYSEHKVKKDATSSLRKDRVTGSSPSLTTAKDEAAVNKNDTGKGSRSLLAEEAAKNYTAPSGYSTLSRRLNTWSGLKPSSWSAQDLRTVGTADDSELAADTATEDDFFSVHGQNEEDSTETTVRAQNKAPPLPPRTSALPSASLPPSSTSSTSPRTKMSVKEVKPDSSNSNGVSADVAFIIKLKSAKPAVDDDDLSTVAPSESSVWTDATGGTDTTDTTLVDEKNQELERKLKSLEKEVERYKKKVERLEKEKKDIMDKQTSPVRKTKSQAEIVKLQRKVHELTSSNEDLVDEKKSLELEVQELSREIEKRPVSGDVDRMLTDLRMRLSKAEALVEDLQEENEELKTQVKEMEEEMEEIHDNFREDQADEYHDLKREIEQANKNCRIIQFKLRKSERVAEELQQQKASLEERLKVCENQGGGSLQQVEKLENELKLAKEVSMKLGEEVEMLRKNSNNLEVKAPVKRQSSASDESKLLRDLQDTLEREADLKEQLKFAEEEASEFRKKLVRVEEENESLAMQLKKMAKKPKRQGSQEGAGSSSHAAGDRDEGISEDIEDLSPQELKIQLELNERETSALRKKVEKVEGENDTLQLQVKELQRKVSLDIKMAVPEISIADPSAYHEQKINVLEEEMNDLRKKLIDKERENDTLKTELEMKSQKGSKVIFARSRSLDLNDSQSVDLKRQLQLVEQEVQMLRAKNSELESEGEKLAVENRRMEVRVAKKPPPTATERLAMERAELEEKLARAERKLTEREKTIGELRTVVKESSGGDSSRLSPSRSPREGRRAERKSEVDVEGLKREKDSLQGEMKNKEKELGTMKKRLVELSAERDKLSEMVNKMKDIPSVKVRTPKKVTDLTPKNTLKKWVEELEDEIALLHIQRKNDSRNSRVQFSQTKDASSPGTETKGSTLERQVEEYKQKVKKLEAEKDDLELSKTSAEKEKSEALREKERLEKEKAKLEREKKKLEETNFSSKATSEEARTLKGRVEKLSKDLAETTKRQSELEKLLESKDQELRKARRGEDAKESTEKELAEKVLMLTEAESKLSSADSKLKRTEKQVKELQEKLKFAEGQLSEAQDRAQQMDNNRRHLSSQWLTEREELKSSMDRLRTRCNELEKSNNERQKRLKELDETRGKVAATVGGASIAKIDALQKEKSSLEKQLKEHEDRLKQLEKEKQAALDKLQKAEASFQKEKEEWEKKQEWEKTKKSAPADDTRFRAKVSLLEKELADQIQDNEDMTRKYELLEEDYVVIKAQMVMEKEQLDGEFTTLKHEYDTVQRELQTLRDTYNNKQDQWIKEKLDMEEKVKEGEEKLNRCGGDAWRIEKARFQELIVDKDADIQKLKKSEEFYMEEINTLKKECDEMRRKLDDYNKVSKIQRTLSVDNSHLEKEIRDLKSRLVADEKQHRQELSHLKIKHDSGLSIMKDELHSLNQQVSKFKRERDTYKSMLEGAQRTIGELKRSQWSGVSPAAAAGTSELFDLHQRIRDMTIQVNSLEDQLSDARLETSKLRTEATTERSAWEIRVHDLQTKINELEEEKIMSSGYARISGMRAKMELAWGKERAEHQRLIQETSKLAEELKNTLHEVERRLENERAESKRRIEQVKQSIVDESTETKKKAKELHDDLLELRDAHAKLRETNRRMIREKDRAEREKEELVQKLHEIEKAEVEEERKITTLMEELEGQLAVASKSLELAETKPHPPPAKPQQLERLNAYPPVTTKGPKASTESDKARSEFQESLKKLTSTMEELKKTHASLMEEKERGRTKNIRQQHYRRSASMGETLGEEDGGRRVQRSGYPAPPPALVMSASRRGNSLGRKSLSMGLRGDSQDSIYEKEEGSVESLDPYSYATLPRKKLERDISIDRVSTGSTQSEIIAGVNPIKKKKGLKGLLKSLGKSRSIEESETGQTIADAGIQAMMPGLQGSGSDISEVSASVSEKEKKGIKSKFNKLFKTPPPSRSEREPVTQSRSPGRH